MGMEGQALESGKAQSFVGRQAELAELSRLVAGGQRLLTVTAPGGYGKSRLVRHFLATLRPQPVHGTAEVPLAALSDPARIASHCAAALHLKLRGAEDPLEQLIDYLREKDLLLYFDNFEHLLAGAGVVAELLAAAPRLRVIATSREPLHLPGENVFDLDALPVETPAEAALNHMFSPAVQLFADRAQTADAQFVLEAANAPAVAELCAALDGVPLAIELAAAWADEYALPELKREIRQQLDITARDASVPERHRSVRASCDWSYRLLNHEQRLILRCLGVFKGGFFLSAGQAVIPATDLEADLNALAAKNWLYTREVLGRTRYFAHDAALREYAYQRLLGTDDFEVAVLMHCRCYGALLSELAAQLRTDAQLDALHELQLEQENLYQALETALKRTEPELLIPFAVHLPDYQLMVGEIRACEALCADMEARARELRCCEARQPALTGQARALLQLGRYEDARRAALGVRQHATECEDARGQALSTLVLGEIERLEGHHHAARKHYQAALELLRSAAVHDMADALHCYGRLEGTEGNFEAARKLILESLELRHSQGDLHGCASSLNDLANIQYRQGRYGEARQLNTQSLELRRRLGDRHGIAQSLHNLGNVEFGEGDYPAAWTLYSESLSIRRDIGERFGIAASLNNLGNVEYCEGNFSDARRLHEQGLAIKREILDRLGIAYSLGNLGNISTRLREYPRAAAELQEGIAIAHELHSAEIALAAVAVAAHLLCAAGALRPAAVAYYAVARLLPEAGLVLDPMDGGMLEEAGLLLGRALAPAARAECEAQAAALDQAALVELAQAELARLIEQDGG